MNGYSSTVLTLSLFAAFGCASATMDQEFGPPGAPLNVKEFHAPLLAAASAYESYGRVDDELRWAPYLCRQPMPSKPRRSMSEQVDTHGRKLYYLFAADRIGYLGRDGKDPSAVGLIVVKEAWTIKEVPADTKFDTQVSPVRYLRQDDKLFFAEDKASLFIMLRLDPKTPGTDQGWVYGTVTPDGKTVTSAGRVGSCMGCHEGQPGRLFGIKYDGA
jgi:hypothetical protein